MEAHSRSGVGRQRLHFGKVCIHRWILVSIHITQCRLLPCRAMNTLHKTFYVSIHMALMLWLVTLLIVLGGVPYDGAVREVLDSNHQALIILYSIAASAGLVFTVFCLLFNMVFRNRK